MLFNTNYPTFCHDLSDPPLGTFSNTVEAPPLVTRAGVHLNRRYRMQPAITDVVAQLAGLGEISS